MNQIIVDGYVKYITDTDKTTVARISVYRPFSKTKDDQKSFLLTVKIFDSPPLNEGDRVVILGRLDGHKYQDKNLFEAICNGRDVFVVNKGGRAAPPPGYPLPPADDGFSQGFRGGMPL